MVKTLLGSTVALRNAIIAGVKIMRSTNSTPTQIEQAQTSVATARTNLAGQEAKLAVQYATILRIAPAYQERSLQTPVSDPFIEAVGRKKLYDAMRKAYIINDADGYIVPYPLTIDNRRRAAP